MAKVQFSARKDPLLRGRRVASERTRAQPTEPAQGRVDADDATVSRPAEPRPEDGGPTGARRPRANALEGPAGLGAVDSADVAAPQHGHSDAAAQRSVSAPEATSPQQRAERSRLVARRVQTSVSLPPDVWDTLDELGHGAGVSAGELLTTILTGAVPSNAEAAFAALEQLLISIGPDEGLQEERNYRLPLELRTRLDDLARALGPGPRLQRSLLIRAIVASHTPNSSEQARELITTRRIEAMRAMMLAAATG